MTDMLSRLGKIPTDSPDQLAEMCQRLDDPDDFNSFFEQYLYPFINDLFNRYKSHTDHVYNDAQQAAFLDVIKALKKGLYNKEKGCFAAWLTTIFKRSYNKTWRDIDDIIVIRKSAKKDNSSSEKAASDCNGKYDYVKMTVSRDYNKHPTIATKMEWNLTDLRLGFTTNQLRAEMTSYRDWFERQQYRQGKKHIPSNVWITLRRIGFLFAEVLGQDRAQIEKLVPWLSNEGTWRFDENWPEIGLIWKKMLETLSDIPDEAEVDELLRELITGSISSNWHNQRDQHRTRMRNSILSFCNDVNKGNDSLLSSIILSKKRYHSVQLRGSEKNV